MSRIGKLPVAVPAGAEVNINGQVVEVKGKLGTLRMSVPEVITPKFEGGEVTVLPRADLVKKAEDKQKAAESRGKKVPTFAAVLDKEARTQWGTARANIANMLEGVSNGFKKTLELHGVGYRAQMQGNAIKLSLGYSHDVIYTAPEGITITTPKPTEIIIEGISKQTVGQVAAEIRSKRPPEPYKGKGVRLAGEYVRRKEGKKK